MTDATARDEQAMVDASAWIARLHAPQVTEGDAADFDAWLAQAPENANAYRRVLSLWHEFDVGADQVLAELETRERVTTLRSPARRQGGRTGGLPRRYLVGGGFGAALAAALAVVVVLPSTVSQPAAQTYATAKGQRQQIRLADGSVIDINAETKLSVSLGKSERRVQLTDGEAIFDVAKDASRPFTVETAEGAVRVVGTQFDVRSRDGQLTVTVARGKVAVRPADGEGPAVMLTPGMQVSLGRGRPEAVASVDPQEAFSWRQGRLVYRDRPLTEVVADLNHQFPQQIGIGDPSLDQIRITGVIVLDNPSAVTQRLALMLPLRTVSSDQGLLLLRK